MPRLAVLADIHGNLPAFQAVLADLECHAPVDRLLVAGDITTGPGQEQIFQILDQLDAVMIQGNGEHDLAAMLTGRAPDYFYSAQQFEAYRWSLEHLSPRSQEILRSLPEQTVYQHPGTDPIRMVHGSPRDYYELVFPDRPGQLETMLALVSEPVMIFGHSHRPWQAQRDHRLALNPGALNFPQTGFLGAQYVILDWRPGNKVCRGRWAARHYQIPYDLAAIQRDYVQSGYLASSPYARVILQSVLTGQDVIPAYFGRLRRMVAEAGCSQLGYYPDQIWERAAAEYPWQELSPC